MASQRGELAEKSELGALLGLRCLWFTRSDPQRGRGDGACTRIRTRDQLIKSQLLYQLSYAGVPVIVFAKSSSACRRGHRRPPALLSKLLSNPKTVVKLDRARNRQIP